MADKNYLHTAYANSADGTDSFTTVYPNLNLLDRTSDQKSNGTVSVGVTHLESLHSDISVTAGEKFVYQALFTSDNTVDLAVCVDLYSGVTWKNYYAGNFIKAGNSGRSIIAFQIPEGVDRIVLNLGLLGYISTKPIIIYWQEEKLEYGSIATPYMQSASEVTTANWPKYIGTYVDTNPVSSTDPSKYVWDEMKYRVYLDGIPVGGSKLLSFDLENLKAGTSYNVQVNQINGNVESDKSESVDFKTTLTK